MATLYCRMKKLTNVVGRRSYISDHERQENLEAFYDTMSLKDWVKLGEENREQFKSMQKKGVMKGLKNKKGTAAECIEAREVVIHMPHGLALKNQDELAKQIAILIKKTYGVDCCVAIHWNKAKSNYHAHIIMSEKERLNEPFVALRNMYYDENWKRCKKSEAVHIIKKGDVIRNFDSKKNPYFKSFEFLQNDLKPLLAKEVDLEVYRDDGIHLTFQKVGKVPEPLKTRILDANENVRIWNQAMDYLIENGASKGELERFRMICYNPDKKEWRNDLVDGVKKLNSNYCVNNNQFIELWNLYQKTTLQLKKEKQERSDLIWDVRETKKEIENERSVGLFKRNRKEIKRLGEAQKRSESRIEQIDRNSTIIPKQLENARSKLFRSRPNFMNTVMSYFGFDELPNYGVANEYYELKKSNQNDEKNNDHERLEIVKEHFINKEKELDDKSR